MKKYFLPNYQFNKITDIGLDFFKGADLIIFDVDNTKISMKDWLRHEWSRTGLSFSKTNEAAGVKDAATRKYFTKCHLWYMPPAEIFDKISKYANKYGKPGGKPYFSIDGKKPLGKEDWEKMRSKFKCPIGITNVWDLPPLNGNERIKTGSKSFHMNQKPLKFTELIIEVSSDEEDLIWDPFGGLGTTAIAAKKLKRYLNKEIICLSHLEQLKSRIREEFFSLREFSPEVRGVSQPLNTEIEV